MNRMAQLRPSPPAADLVSRWSDLHSASDFVINDDEVHCLRTVALNHADDEVACLLLRKLAMAKLLHPLRMPLDVVALNGIAEFTFGSSDVQRRRVVHPHAVRSAVDLSVASVLGAGLIGLHAGQTILWPDDHGRLRDLSLLSVAYDGGGLVAVPPGSQACQ